MLQNSISHFHTGLRAKFWSLLLLIGFTLRLYNLFGQTHMLNLSVEQPTDHGSSLGGVCLCNGSYYALVHPLNLLWADSQTSEIIRISPQGQITERFELTAWSNKLVCYQGKLLISSVAHHHIYLFDSGTLQLVSDTLFEGDYAISDDVLASGATAYITGSATAPFGSPIGSPFLFSVACLDSDLTLSIHGQWTHSMNSSPTNSSRSTLFKRPGDSLRLYHLHHDLHVFSISNQSLALEDIIPLEFRYSEEPGPLYNPYPFAIVTRTIVYDEYFVACRSQSNPNEGGLTPFRRIACFQFDYEGNLLSDGKMHPTDSPSDISLIFPAAEGIVEDSEGNIWILSRISGFETGNPNMWLHQFSASLDSLSQQMVMDDGFEYWPKVLLNYQDGLIIAGDRNLHGNILPGTDHIITEPFMLFLPFDELSSAKDALTSTRRNIRSFPNPTQDQFWLQGLEEGRLYHGQIRSATGQVMKQNLTLANGQSIDVRGLAKGLYLLVVEDDKGNRQTIRFVKL